MTAATRRGGAEQSGRVRTAVSAYYVLYRSVRLRRQVSEEIFCTKSFSFARPCTNDGTVRSVAGCTKCT